MFFALDMNDDFLLNQIETLHLNAAVAWIGSHFSAFIKRKLSQNAPVLFFNWIPNDLTASQNYSRMLFPTCISPDSNELACDFQLHQLTKMMWSVIRTHTPEAYHVVTKMEFSQVEINELLLSFVEISEQGSRTREEALEEAACRWVRDYKRKWQRWLPANLSSKTPIYLGGMFPLSGPYWRSPGILPGMFILCLCSLIACVHYFLVFIGFLCSLIAYFHYLFVFIICLWSLIAYVR